MNPTTQNMWDIATDAFKHVDPNLGAWLSQMQPAVPFYSIDDFLPAEANRDAVITASKVTPNPLVEEMFSNIQKG